MKKKSKRINQRKQIDILLENLADNCAKHQDRAKENQQRQIRQICGIIQDIHADYPHFSDVADLGYRWVKGVAFKTWKFITFK